MAADARSSRSDRRRGGRSRGNLCLARSGHHGRGNRSHANHGSADGRHRNVLDASCSGRRRAYDPGHPTTSDHDHHKVCDPGHRRVCDPDHRKACGHGRPTTSDPDHRRACDPDHRKAYDRGHRRAYDPDHRRVYGHGCPTTSDPGHRRACDPGHRKAYGHGLPTTSDPDHHKACDPDHRKAYDPGHRRAYDPDHHKACDRGRPTTSDHGRRKACDPGHRRKNGRDRRKACGRRARHVSDHSDVPAAPAADHRPSGICARPPGAGSIHARDHRRDDGPDHHVPVLGARRYPARRRRNGDTGRHRRVRLARRFRRNAQSSGSRRDCANPHDVSHCRGSYRLRGNRHCEAGRPASSHPPANRVHGSRCCVNSAPRCLGNRRGASNPHRASIPRVRRRCENHCDVQRPRHRIGSCCCRSRRAKPRFGIRARLGTHRSGGIRRVSLRSTTDANRCAQMACDHRVRSRHRRRVVGLSSWLQFCLSAVVSDESVSRIGRCAPSSCQRFLSG